jgi:phosphonatase-like hydrolase
MAARLKLAIFDIYGTILRDGGQVSAAFQTALQSGGLPFSAEQLSSVRGASKRDAISVLVENRFGASDPGNADRIQAAYASFQTDLLARFKNRPVNFVAGTLGTFRWLREKGVALALNTGFDRVIADTIIDRLPWNGFSIETLVCGDDVTQGRPAPLMILKAMEQAGVAEAAQVMTVGDTTKDLEAGNNAGVGINIGVLSGAHDRAHLQQVAHTQILPSIADIPDFLTKDAA